MPEFEGYSDLPSYNRKGAIQLVTDKGTETVAVGSTRHNQLQRLHKLEAVKLYLKSSENLNLTSDAFNMITAYAPDLANFDITTSNEKLAGPQSTFKVSEINKILNREGMMDNIRKSITDGTSSVPTPILDPKPSPNKTSDKSSITKENVREIFFDGNFTTLARVMKFAKKPELQNILSKDPKDYKPEDIKEVSTKLNNFAKELNKVENLNFKQFIKFDKDNKLESTSLRDLIKLLKLYSSSKVTSPEVTSSEVTETTTQKVPSSSNQDGGKMKAFRKQQSQKKEKQFNEAMKEDKEKREKLKTLYKSFIATNNARLKNSLKTQINNKIKELSLTADEGVELYDTDNYKSLKTYLGL